MDVPYLIHASDGDELWLVDGEHRMLITPRIYDLLASNGADLPPAYGIEELREQNAKLRKLARGLGQCAQGVNCEDCLLYDLSEPDHCREERLSRELGIEAGR